MVLIPNTKPRKKSTEQVHVPAQKVVVNSASGARVQLRFNKKRFTIGALIVAALLIAVSLASGVVLATSGLAAKDAVLAAEASLQAQEFDKAKAELAVAEKHFKRARLASRGFFWVKWLPWVHTQFLAVDNLLEGAQHVSSGLQHMADVGTDVFSSLQDESVTIANLEAKQRKAMLEGLSASPEKLEDAQADLAKAVDSLNEIPKKGVIKPLADAIVPVQEQLPVLDQIVNKALPFLKVAPAILGYPDEQVYLFLLQNNTELRPTGGFIGTYGILVMKNADIKEFKTDNIYNLDFPVKKTLFIDPPEPLAKYLVISQWFMRDANWDPDFARTAKKVEEFYHLEDGPTEKIDGVIAVTPDVIVSLLELTGPVVVDGQEFTAENLIEKLQYEVEIGFKQDGISESARKDIIGRMADALMERVTNLPRDQWFGLIEKVLQDLDEKQMLVYSKNPEAQRLIDSLDWGGTIQRPKSDFVMVVDANLAAKKTDRVMTKNIDYTIKPDENTPGQYIATLRLRYKNDGTFDFFTTRYRTYTRIYVPRGSQLISADGFLTTDRNEGGQPTAPIVTQDLEVDKTVFEGFISAEPKTEEIVTLTYTLPASVVEDIDAGEYSLFMQKQPGTSNVTFNAELQFEAWVNRAVGLDNIEKIKNNAIRFSTPLLTDKNVSVNL